MAKGSDAVRAAVDIGSNSFRLLVAGQQEEGLEKIEYQLATVGLGRGLTAGGCIAPAALARSETVLRSFAHIIGQHRVASCRACGTEALRRAENRGEFLQLAHDILGFEVEVISGEEEAALTLTGVMQSLKGQEDAPLLVVDVGGGSTEFIGSDPGGQTMVRSLPIGAVGLTEKFDCNTTAGGRERQRLAAYIRERIAPVCEMLAGWATPPVVVASGGTATAMAAIHLGLAEYDGGKVQGSTLQVHDVANLCDRFSRMTLQEKKGLPGLDQERGEIILAGAEIYLEFLEDCRVPKMLISDAGLLEGILLRMEHVAEMNVRKGRQAP